MIGGLLIDAIVLLSIFAFEWAGPQLGATDAIRRAVACAIAALASILMRDPVGSVLRDVLHTSEDLSNLLGMIAVGVAAYLAASSLLRWRNAQRADRIFDGYDSKEFGSPVLAAVDGGVLGLGWAVLFISFLVLMPSDNFVSRAAVKSVTGGLLIRQERALNWISDGFPHYTQQLPKGKVGAVVGEEGSLPMRGDEEPKSAPRDTEALVRNINRLRSDRERVSLAYNPDIAGVARRHALALASERVLSYRSPSGGKIDSRVLASLGENATSFEEEVGIEVVWAHSPANAGRGLAQDARATRLLRDEKWSEIGIGIADAGWFNGKIYVIVLVAALEEDAEAASPAEGDAGEDGDLPVDGGP